MTKSKMNKKRKTLVVAISILLILVLTTVSLAIHKHYIISKVEKTRYQLKFIQYLYHTSRIIDLAERDKIIIDEEFKLMIQKHSKKLLKNLDYEGLYATQLAELIWLNEYYSLGYESKLKSELDNHYNNKTFLFEDDIRLIKGDIEQNISTTQFVFDTLESTSLAKAYNFYKPFAEYCNKNDRFLEDNNFGDLLYLSSIVIKLGHKELLDVERMHEKFKPLVERSLVEFTDESYEKNISSVSGTESISDYYCYFENDNSYTNLTQQVYNSMPHTDETYLYNKNDEYFTVFFFISILEVKNLKENEYIEKNLNIMLKDNYKSSIKHKFDKVYKYK